MLLTYLCADGNTAPDEMQSQIIVCFIFYAICLFLKLCHNAQTRERGHPSRASPPCSAIFMPQPWRRREMEKLDHGVSFQRLRKVINMF